MLRIRLLRPSSSSSSSSSSSRVSCYLRASGLTGGNGLSLVWAWLRYRSWSGRGSATRGHRLAAVFARQCALNQRLHLRSLSRLQIAPVVGRLAVRFGALISTFVGERLLINKWRCTLRKLRKGNTFLRRYSTQDRWFSYIAASNGVTPNLSGSWIAI